MKYPPFPLSLIVPLDFKLIQKIDERTLPNSFYKAIITLISTPDKDTTRKESYTAISLMSIDSKILSEIQANQIQ